MKRLVRAWRTWWHGRKFARKGKHCRFQGRFLLVDGHVEVGDHTRFRENVILRTHGEGRIIIGNHSMCGFYTIIESSGQVRIGDETAITEFCVIRDTNHVFYGTDAHWAATPHITKPVTIGNKVLLGARTYVHPGVTIGDGAIIGVGSVLAEDTRVGPLEIWAGVPARKLGHRTEGVPEDKLREAQELLAKHGVRKFRY